MNRTRPAGRTAGLDTLRALAICLVLMTHYEGFVSRGPTFGLVGMVGWAGVDLFFVLSGYLIGHQIVAPLAQGRPLSLKVFYARRLLRTLPNYCAVLLVYFLLPGPPLEGTHTDALWRYLSFTQNFGLRYGETYTHSWSLCVEEQFYLVLPLAALALARFGTARRMAWWVLGAAVAAGCVARGNAALVHGYDAFSAEVYYATTARFDELLFGVAIALLQHGHPGAYARLLRRGNLLWAGGTAGAIGVLWACNDDFPNSFVATTFGFSSLAACFGLLTLAALSPQTWLHRARVPGAAALARGSYAVYLVHKPLFMILGPQLSRWGADATSAPVVALVMTAGVAGGWLLYRGVETPFTRLRSRWFPTPKEMASNGDEPSAHAPQGSALALPPS